MTASLYVFSAIFVGSIVASVGIFAAFRIISAHRQWRNRNGDDQ